MTLVTGERYTVKEWQFSNSLQNAGTLICREAGNGKLLPDCEVRVARACDISVSGKGTMSIIYMFSFCFQLHRSQWKRCSTSKHEKSEKQQERSNFSRVPHPVQIALFSWQKFLTSNQFSRISIGEKTQSFILTCVPEERMYGYKKYDTRYVRIGTLLYSLLMWCSQV